MYSFVSLFAAALVLAAASCNGPMHTDSPSGPIAPLDPGAAGLEGAAEGLTGFSLGLFREVQRGEAEANVFVAPASVAFALAMTHGGAEGETRDAIAAALGAGSDDALDGAIDGLRAAFTGAGDDVRLSTANSLWARDGIPFRSEFLDATRTRFGAEVTTLDFAAPGAVDRINEWVNRETEGRIAKLLDRLNPEEVLFLVNAVYFKGQWSEPFDPRLTRPGAFTLSDGTRIEHPMMSRTDDFDYRAGEGWEAVRIPYGEEGRYAMYVFLPEADRGLDALYAQLDAERWESWMDGFEPRRLALSMPRFRVEYEAALRPMLERLGMQVAFDPARADFGGMLPRDFLDRNNAYITRVQHKTFVEVNEEGTEAAGATGVGIGIVSMPPSFTVDRPFFLAIRDDQSGALLFAGQIGDPRG